MYPSLGPVPTHALFVGLGVLAAIGVFVVEARRRGQTDDKVVYVVLGALVGGAVFMRLGTWLQHVDLRQNASLAEQWLYGNRSILGGLVGAWLGVHVAKRLVGYRARTGDLFAPAVALGMAVGRVGCLLTELPGTPTGTSWGIPLDPARPRRARRARPAYRCTRRSPTRSSSTLAAFCVLWFWLRHRVTAPGETLTFYLAAYGVFRFLVEFVRGNEVVWLGLTRPQLFLLVTVPLLLARIAWQARRGVYRRADATDRPVPLTRSRHEPATRRHRRPATGRRSAAAPLRRPHARRWSCGRCSAASTLVVTALLGDRLLGSSDDGAICRSSGRSLGLALADRAAARRRPPGGGASGMLIGYFLALIVLGGACVAS